MLVMSAFAFASPLVFHCFEPGLKKTTVIILLCAYLHVWLWGGGGSALNHTSFFPFSLNNQQPALRVHLSLTRVSVACSQE